MYLVADYFLHNLFVCKFLAVANTTNTDQQILYFETVSCKKLQFYNLLCDFFYHLDLDGKKFRNFRFSVQFIPIDGVI